MIFSVDQILAHLVGDYLLQSSWMAQNKTSHSIPALAHSLMYTIPFLLLTQSPMALAVIAGTHYLIDRYRLIRYLVWAKNYLAPPGWGPPPFSECAATGNPPGVPPFLAVWLMIIADNVTHVLVNGLAINLFG